jgi:hypothetical protein
MQIHEVTHRQDEGFIKDFGKAVGKGLLKDVERYALGTNILASPETAQPAVPGTGTAAKPVASPTAAGPTAPATVPAEVYKVGGQVLDPRNPTDAKLIAQIQKAGKT